MHYECLVGGNQPDARGLIDKCPACGTWVDLDDPWQVLAHELVCVAAPAPPIANEADHLVVW